MANAYYRTGLIGGTTNDLDNIEVAGLSDGDVGMVLTGGNRYWYKYVAANSDSESSPDVIIPDDNSSGTGAWVYQSNDRAVEQVTGITEDNVWTSDGSGGLKDGGAIEQITAPVKNPLALSQAIHMTAADSGSNGIQVANNDDINFGTGDFTLVWKGSVPDWGENAYFFSK